MLVALHVKDGVGPHPAPTVAELEVPELQLETTNAAFHFSWEKPIVSSVPFALVPLRHDVLLRPSLLM